MTHEAALAFSAAISGFALPTHCSLLLSLSCGCLEPRATEQLSRSRLKRNA